MVQGPSPEIIEAIRNPPSLEAQINSLQQLKNEINGHDQRKEAAVRHGVVAPLVDILAAPAKAAGKRSINGLAGVQQQQQHQEHVPITWTPEHAARLEATIILSSLATGGPAFVPPLLAAGLDHALVRGTEEDDPPKLVTATLQALRNLTASAALTNESWFAPSLASEGVLEPLLKRALLNSASQPQQKLAAEIVSLLAKNESLRPQLAEGLLHPLASLLVSHTVANKYFEYRGSISNLPQPPPNTRLPDILAAITAIVTGSNFRIQSFILSPSIRDFFSSLWSDNVDSRFVFNPRSSMSSPFEQLLPQLHIPAYKSVSFNSSSAAFPALGSLQSDERRPTGTTADGAPLAGDPDHANDVVKWLIFLARSMHGLNRLIALRLLALVNHAIDADFHQPTHRSEAMQRQKERERHLALLAIPLAVQLVHDAAEIKTSGPFPPLEPHETKAVKEQACDVLASLIRGSKDLQNAAVEAGAIKRVCPILKQSFDTVTIAKPMWSAHAPGPSQSDVPDSNKVGPHGLPPEIRHAMLCRQSSLEALAALSRKEDVHRKAIVDAGVVSCVIDSLKPLTADFSAAMNRGSKPPHQFTAKDGNTIPVILAACHAAQNLSRSVSLLRTSLIDAGIAKPTFELLKHSDPEVQIAATDVCCNLLLEFSPMREDLVGAGAIKTLTEHARQSEMGLRLSSLWALKHLVLSSSREVKTQCLEELGAGWLVGAIQGEQSNAAADLAGVGLGGVSIPAGIGLSTPNAAGEQVNLLNPSTTMEVDDQVDDDEAVEDEEDEDGEIMYDEAAGTHYQASQLRSTLYRLRDTALASTSNGFNSARYLSSVREMEQNPVLQAKRDDIAVQEQALDFIRNMLNGDDCAFMIEHLLRTIGQDKLFSLLSDKLAPLTPSLMSSSASSIRGPSHAKILYQPTELVLNTVHVLTHIANGSPTHKQLLIAQKHLLANWLPHFNHPDRRVRVMSVWAVNSLTWVEDDADRLGATQRAKELRVCGIEQAIKSLVNDVDLDVRERVKTAVRQIDVL